MQLQVLTDAPPVAEYSTAENSTAVTTVIAADPDGGAQLTYSIAGGADAALFNINASTGVLTFNNAPDFENPADTGSDNVYDVTVQVSDGSLTNTQAIAVTVTNVNDAPVLTAPLFASPVSENTPTAIAGISVSDADAGTDAISVSFGVSHGTLAISGSGLTIDGNETASLSVTGTVADINAALAGSLIYTSVAGFHNDSDTIAITVDDLSHNGSGGAATATGSVIVTVNNVAPTIDNATLSAIDEDVVSGSNAGNSISSIFSGKFHDTAGATLTAIAIASNSANASTEGTWQYSTNGGSNWFDVSTVSGTSTLVLAASSLLRFAPAGDYNGTPTALSVYGLDDTYSGGVTSDATRQLFNPATSGSSGPVSASTATVGITITPVNDAPVLNANGASLSYSEDQSPAAIAPSIAVSDVDNTNPPARPLPSPVILRPARTCSASRTRTTSPAATIPERAC